MNWHFVRRVLWMRLLSRQRRSCSIQPWPVGQSYKTNEFEPKDLRYCRYKGAVKARRRNEWLGQAGCRRDLQRFRAHFLLVRMWRKVADIKSKTEKSKVLKVYCAVDCGRVMNPLGAEQQIEGGIIDGLVMPCMENLCLIKEQCSTENFNTYKWFVWPMPRNRNTLRSKKRHCPDGFGRAGFATHCAAVANAVFAATGQSTLRKQPFSFNHFIKIRYDPADAILSNNRHFALRPFLIDCLRGSSNQYPNAASRAI